MTIAEARAGLASKSFTALELTDAHLAAIEAARVLNAYILHAVMRWAINQQGRDNTDTSQRLIGWVKSKLLAIEHQRKRLLPDE